MAKGGSNNSSRRALRSNEDVRVHKKTSFIQFRSGDKDPNDKYDADASTLEPKKQDNKVTESCEGIFRTFPSLTPR